MKIHDPKTIASELPLLELSSATTEAEAKAALRIFDQFEGLMAGVTHFSGLPPWECHPQDELLYVLDGSVEVNLSELACQIEKLSEQASFPFYVFPYAQ